MGAGVPSGRRSRPTAIPVTRAVPVRRRPWPNATAPMPSTLPVRSCVGAHGGQDHLHDAGRLLLHHAVEDPRPVLDEHQEQHDRGHEPQRPCLALALRGRCLEGPQGDWGSSQRCTGHVGLQPRLLQLGRRPRDWETAAVKRPSSESSSGLSFATSSSPLASPRSSRARSTLSARRAPSAAPVLGRVTSSTRRPASRATASAVFAGLGRGRADLTQANGVRTLVAQVGDHDGRGHGRGKEQATGPGVGLPAVDLDRQPPWSPGGELLHRCRRHQPTSVDDGHRVAQVLHQVELMTGTARLRRRRLLREHVGQRVNGTVHISDIPTGEQGRVYLVEQNLITMGELQAIVDDYTPPRPPSSATPRCRRGSNASRRALYPGARLATRVRTHRSA